MVAFPPLDPHRAMTRRGLLRSGGMTVTIGALVAACGSGEDGAPGRVGNAPVVTVPPELQATDSVLLRTATSLEYTAIKVYDTVAKAGMLDDDDKALALIDRFVQDHQGHADTTAELTTRAGGEAYECPNEWLMERAVAPVLQHINGDEAAGIEPSDDPARDLLAVSYALESVAGATYQMMVEQLRDQELRQQLILIAAQEVRHAAAVAIARTGAPEAYVSPVLFGQDLDPTANGGAGFLYAIPGKFGSVAPVDLVIGAENDAGTRFTTPVATPAENAYVYEGLTCQT